MTPLRLDKNESPILWDGLRRAPLDADLLRRYPDESPLRSAWADDLGLDPDCVLPTNGGDEAIEAAMRGLVGAGRTVVAPVPTFSTFQTVAERLGQRLVGVPYERDGAFPTEALIETIRRERPAGVVLIDPNNPTGTSLPRGVLESVRAAAPEATIILDRAYGEFAGLDDDAALIGGDFGLVIVRSLSKCPGLAGLRVGALIGASDLIGKARRERLIFSVNAAAAALGVEALRDRDGRTQCVRTVKASRQALIDGLARLGVPYLTGPTNFALALLSERAGDVLAACLERGLFVRDLSGCPVFPGGVRITVGDEQTTRRAVEILGQALDAAGWSPQAARRSAQEAPA